MIVDVLSNMDMFDLENDLPDELMSSSSWLGNDHLGGSKPPAQGPGPGAMQNGVDAPDGPQALRQMQLNHHLLQQQVMFHICISNTHMYKQSLTHYGHVAFNKIVIE